MIHITRLIKKRGGDLLSRFYSVPSALSGLTALFGMGRGVPRCHNHLKIFQMTFNEEEKKMTLKKAVAIIL